MVKFFNVKSSGVAIVKEVVHGLGINAIADAVPAVRNIISDVKNNGDAAIIKYTAMFDRIDANSIQELKATQNEIDEAYNNCSKELISSLELAASRIEAYHKKQMPDDIDYIDEMGIRLGNLWKPIKVAGLYVPGGTASYPSSVLMNAIPAKVAGVEEMVMTTPVPGGKFNPAVLCAAHIAGIKHIYKIGGAQAIAAMALNGNSIPNVDKIVGPGNAYVAAAKRELSNIVGIDMIAGPSEILVVADKNTNPEWIAADLLSQAEHDENAQSILITNEESYAKEVVAAVEKILNTLPRAAIARPSWENKGTVIVDEGFANTIELINYISPEHLELAVDHANDMVKDVRNAGAIFLGRYTPEAIGDYTAGPSHVLPTSGTARFSSGLSVYDFMKRVSLIECTEDSFVKISEKTACLADAEGLSAHALSVRIRNNT